MFKFHIAKLITNFIAVNTLNPLKYEHFALKYEIRRFDDIRYLNSINKTHLHQIAVLGLHQPPHIYYICSENQIQKKQQHGTHIYQKIQLLFQVFLKEKVFSFRFGFRSSFRFWTKKLVQIGTKSGCFRCFKCFRCFTYL